MRESGYIDHVLELFSVDEQLRYSMMDEKTEKIVEPLVNEINQLEMDYELQLEEVEEDLEVVKDGLSDTDKILNHILDGISDILDAKMTKKEIITELKRLT